MDADKPVPMVNIKIVRFIGGPQSQVRTGRIQGSWEPEISVAVITTVGEKVEGDLYDIVMKSRNVVIYMECDGETSWVKSLG